MRDRMMRRRSGTKAAGRARPACVLPALVALAALVAGLAVTAAGAGTTFAASQAAMAAPAPGPAPAPGGAANRAAGQVPPEVVDKSNTAWDNHVEILRLRWQCAAVTDQIRHKVQELRAAGAVIPDETRRAIKDSRDAIRAGRKTLRDTAAQMRAELKALHQARKAKDWTAVLTHLETIISIQQTRLEEGGRILSELQNILTLLDSVGSVGQSA